MKKKKRLQKIWKNFRECRHDNYLRWECMANFLKLYLGDMGGGGLGGRGGYGWDALYARKINKIKL